MKKLFTLFEDLWVVIAFAEAGLYEPTITYGLQRRCHSVLPVHSA